MKRELMEAIEEELERERSSTDATAPPANKARLRRGDDEIEGDRFC